MVTAELLPGERLPDERTMAIEYGVSRTSIREAIKMLEASGILVVRKALGIFVSQNPGVLIDPLGMSYISDKEKMLNDWYAARLILEPEIIRMVIENATDEEIEQIIGIGRQEAEAVKAGRSDFLEIDKNFHGMLAKATHNEVMMRLIPTLHESAYYGIAGERLPAQIIEEALTIHKEIIRFLEIRDAMGAMLAMRYHLLVAAKYTKCFSDAFSGDGHTSG